MQSSTELWRERVNAFNESGMRIGAFCRQHELSQTRLRYWRNKLCPGFAPRRTKHFKQTQPLFVQIKPAPVKQEVIIVPVEIEVAGTILKVVGLPDPEWFASVLQGLAGGKHVFQ